MPIDRPTTKQLIIKSIQEYRNLLYNHPLLNTEDELATVIPRSYDKDSIMRLLGAEDYFRTTFFNVLENKKRFFTNDPMDILSVESRLKDKRRPDIILWHANGFNRLVGDERRNLHMSQAILKVELKVTGYYLVDKNYRMKDGSPREQFLNDLIAYSQDESISTGNCLFLFGCYYEDSRQNLMNLIEPHGSLTNWLIANREQEINDMTGEITENMRTNTLEFFAFQNPNEQWLYIDNEEERIVNF